MLGIFLVEVEDRRLIIYQVIIIILIAIISLTILRFLTKRAYAYHLLLSIIGIFIVVTLWEIAFMISGKTLTFIVSFGSVTIILGFWLIYLEQKRSFIKNRSIRIQSGAFDPDVGHWDSTIKFTSMNSGATGKTNTSIQKIGKYLFPLGPIIGYFLSRMFAQRGHLEVFSMILLVLASFLAFLGASYLSLTSEILNLEKIYMKEIELVTRNE